MDQQKLAPARTEASNQEQAKARAEVEKILAEFASVIREGQLDRIMSFYSNDMVSFDMMPPLRFTDLREYRQLAWKDCFIDQFRFPVQYAWSEQQIHVGGDLAVAHGLIHMMGHSKGADKNLEAWLRSTIVLKRHDGEWLITHEHSSAPYDKESGEVLMNLKPYEATH